MGTKDFNILDIFIANMRLARVTKYINKGDDVLDFGCGNQALLLTSMKDKINKGVGLDYDADDRKIGKNIEVKQFKFDSKLPFKDNSFNKIVMLAVIEHIPLDVIPKLFKEFYRVLKPGGKIVYTTPTPESKPILEFMAFKLHIISAPEIADHKKYYSEKDMDQLAAAYRYRLVHYSTFQFGWNSLTVLEK